MEVTKPYHSDGHRDTITYPYAHDGLYLTWHETTQVMETRHPSQLMGNFWKRRVLIGVCFLITVLDMLQLCWEVKIVTSRRILSNKPINNEWFRQIIIVCRLLEYGHVRPAFRVPNTCDVMLKGLHLRA